MAKTNGVIKRRGDALIEEFYRAAPTPDPQQADRETLALASGIHDEGTLRLLIDLTVSLDVLSAMTLVPLVEVAWADGQMDTEERAAILRAAADQGIDPASRAHDLLARWLDRRPPAGLFDAWRAYIQVVLEPLLPEEREQLREALIGRARAVAEAAGGFLGIGAISKEEEQVLERLARALRST